MDLVTGRFRECVHMYSSSAEVSFRCERAILAGDINHLRVDPFFDPSRFPTIRRPEPRSKWNNAL